MKRLVKKSDAARLHSLSINPSDAMNAILNKNNSLVEDRLIKDKASNSYAYWGSISDDCKYIVEAYLYDETNTSDKKAAYVVADIVDNGGQFALGNIVDVIIHNVSGASELRSNVINNGLTLSNGEKITFSKEEAEPFIPEEEIEETKIAKLINKGK